MSFPSLSRSLHFVAGAIFGLLSIMSLAAPPAPTAAPAPAPAPATRTDTRSPGCTQATAARTGVFTLSAKDGSGKDRTYVLQAPPAYSSSRSYPLIFVFHGAGGSAKESMSWGLQNATNAGATGIFVFPNGIPYRNYGVGWDDSSNGYDLPLFDAMLKDVGSAYCVDLSRVFVAGFSWGGDFVTALACNRGDAIRAVAANSTDDEFKDPANFMTYQNLPCTSHRHPPVRFQHATGGDKSYPAPLFATTSKLYQYLNACSPTSSSVAPANAAMSCASYTACASEYVECSFDARIGHALPPNWAEDTWAFFSKF
jgi:poly(3-hydroxybutyrate) depolymerase